MKAAIVLISSLVGPLAWGSTFIGNGGNAGDVELAVTHRQLQAVFTEIPDRDPEARALCECTGEFDNHPLCDALKKLNAEQAKFCTEQLKIRSDEMVRLNERVRVQWTHDFVEVSEGGRTRGADAVANRAADEITINTDRFLELKSYEREFLFAHELFHFTSYQGKPLTDEGPVGPFEGQDGSRRLINAMAAAVVMESVDEGLISKYQRSLKRPQGWKHSWLSVDGGTSRNEKEQSGTFPNNEYSKTSASFRYHFSNGFGVMLSSRWLRASKSVLTSTKIDDTSQALGLGVAYRYFPAKDPLTFFGQAHFVLHALLENISAKYSYKDDFNPATDDSASTIGESLGCSYYMPMFWGLWVYVGGSYDIQSYQFSKALVKYDTNKLTSSIGASYAF